MSAGPSCCNGDRPTGKQIGDHLRSVRAALPPGVKQIYGRADSGFSLPGGRRRGYEEIGARFVLCARKTARLVEELRQAEVVTITQDRCHGSHGQCEFLYQPDGWSKLYRFVALRKPKPREELEAEETEQYQLFESQLRAGYRVFVTDFVESIDFVVWFYGQRGGFENLIKEANNGCSSSWRRIHRAAST